MAKNNNSNDFNQSLTTDEFSQAQLEKKRDELVKKLNRQKLVLAALRDIKAEQVTNITDEERKHIDYALNYARAFDHLKLDDKGNNVLGISNTPPPLTYFEQKAVKEKLFEHMEKKYEKRADYIRRMKPGVLDQTALDQQLADAKKRDSELVDEVAEKEAKLCGVLAECMELKADNPALQKKIELLKEQATKHEQRAGVMKGLLQNITSSNIGTKAKPIMEKYVDEELARANSDEPTFLHK